MNCFEIKNNVQYKSVWFYDKLRFDRNSTKMFKNAGMREIFNGGLKCCRSHLRSEGSTVSSPGDKLYLFLMNYSSFNLHSTVKK